MWTQLKAHLYTWRGHLYTWRISDLAADLESSFTAVVVGDEVNVADDRTLESTSRSNNDEVVIQMATKSDDKRVENLNLADQKTRSWSIRKPMAGVMRGFGKFRSHSIGHTLVQSGENLERFTLRLPERVRKEVMDRASLNRTRSLAVATSLPRQGSWSRARFYRRIEREGGKSDRWVFFSRGMSIKSPKMAAGGSEGEGSSWKPVFGA